MRHGFEATDTRGGFCWRPDPTAEVVSVDLRLPIETLATGWNRLLTRSMHVRSERIRLDSPPPRAVSIAIAAPAVRLRSFVFDQSPQSESNWFDQPSDSTSKMAPASESPTSGSARAMVAASGCTRVKPPNDIIKLEDRLRYLLQPPLETLMAQRSIEFPFQPFPYQLEGVAFLYPRHSAVLADEMGLGKTMQAITTIRLLLRSGEIRSVLLVCPKPLVTNWRREFDLWAPELPTMVIEGDQARRRWQWRLPDAPIKIANYELLRRDREIYEGAASGDSPLQFDLVVLDESQRIKNRTSATSKAVRAISRSRNWALTGTPVENSPEDLVGIFEFLSPGFLQSEMKPRLMGRRVSDHVLRRTKDKVLTDLPPKLIRDAELQLSPEQRVTYEMAEGEGVLRLGEMGQSATIGHVFELVLRLKQICNFDPATGASAKLDRLEAELEEVAQSGRKAIVFSQWVETLKRIKSRLQRFGPLEYHGRVPSRLRDGVIERFRQDADCHVILMSYGAGGVGLNLQFAGYVFLFDRWWNPAVEDQAINRAHRIGVEHPVFVSRFLTQGTIEERIHLVLEEKRELFDTIFSDAQKHSKLGLTQQELFGLFDLTSPSGPVKYAA